VYNGNNVNGPGPCVAQARKEAVELYRVRGTLSIRCFVPFFLCRNSADSYLSADNFACEMHFSDSEVRHYLSCTIS
jgi:hypothetical protein